MANMEYMVVVLGLRQSWPQQSLVSVKLPTYRSLLLATIQFSVWLTVDLWTFFNTFWWMDGPLPFSASILDFGGILEFPPNVAHFWREIPSSKASSGYTDIPAKACSMMPSSIRLRDVSSSPFASKSRKKRELLDRWDSLVARHRHQVSNVSPLRYRSYRTDPPLGRYAPLVGNLSHHTQSGAKPHK